MIKNIEFKAKYRNVQAAEAILNSLNAEYRGEDHQTDTYFNVRSGRLKMRQGNIENALIYYQREDNPDASPSDVILYNSDYPDKILSILKITVGVKIIVKKIRKIYLIKNVKIHLDKVSRLGTFLEVEAIDSDNTRSASELQEQCEHFKKVFAINDTDLISVSYSDMLLALDDRNELFNV